MNCTSRLLLGEAAHDDIARGVAGSCHECAYLHGIGGAEGNLACVLLAAGETVQRVEAVGAVIDFRVCGRCLRFGHDDAAGGKRLLYVASLALVDGAEVNRRGVELAQTLEAQGSEGKVVGVVIVEEHDTGDVEGRVFSPSLLPAAAECERAGDSHVSLRTAGEVEVVDKRVGACAAAALAHGHILEGEQAHAVGVLEREGAVCVETVHFAHFRFCSIVLVLTGILEGAGKSGAVAVHIAVSLVSLECESADQVADHNRALLDAVRVIDIGFPAVLIAYEQAAQIALGIVGDSGGICGVIVAHIEIFFGDFLNEHLAAGELINGVFGSLQNHLRQLSLKSLMLLIGVAFTFVISTLAGTRLIMSPSTA